MTWSGFVIGLATLVVGLVLCLRGAVVMRLLIALWAGLVGAFVGAGSIAAVTGERFLADAVAFLAAVVVGVLFATVAYTVYEVAIMVAMAAFGFTLATDTMVALGVSWSWLVALVGVLSGLVLGLGALVMDLPIILLVLLSAFTGSSVTLTGLVFLTGTVTPGDLADESTSSVLQDRWWWWTAYVALALIGAMMQVRLLRSWMTPVHAGWNGRSAGSPVG
ncbi:protein of unknown function [Nocardioides terrae]|uniref:TM7S3/TM198-like domain-containing protein n=1 Tax=Nocardioides terrae TaxID=574651 RepID=A0A1I1K9G6_9ACTN|nr:DUF4203 domain-containing protein [Nocardioides terrae]SFC57529.1 protein of unknown function [Nocardioides terrae]